MKSYKHLYLFTGFLIGILYMVACSGGSNSTTAQGISRTARDIFFDNTECPDLPTNVHDIIKEFDSRLQALEGNTP